MSFQEAMEKPRKIMLSDARTKSFLQMANRLDSYIQTHQKAGELQVQAEFLERLPDGRICAQKRLPLGLILRASPKKEDPSTTTLQIFFDPLRFRAWRKSLGPIDMFYSNPYGIEVVKEKQTQQWGIFLDTQEILLKLTDSEVYEAARVEIRGTHGGREVVRVK